MLRKGLRTAHCAPAGVYPRDPKKKPAGKDKTSAGRRLEGSGSCNIHGSVALFEAESRQEVKQEWTSEGTADPGLASYCL